MIMSLPKVYESRGVPDSSVPEEFMFAIDITVLKPTYYKRVGGVWELINTEYSS